MKHALLAVAFGLFATHVQAQVGLHEPDAEIMNKTLEIFKQKNVDSRGEAEERLKKEGEIFNRVRVEISGIISSDDSNRIIKEGFDDKITPSVLKDKNRNWVDILRTYDDDTREMQQSMRGQMTAESRANVARFRNLEINEIVAHSWGTELIYAAILNGDMLPPKKLIVMGVPDDDHEKWELLAARTGTEVIWMRAANDSAAGDKGVRLAKEAARSVNFAKRWDMFCRDNNFSNRCPAHGRVSKPVNFINIGALPMKILRPMSLLGHERAEYLKILIARRIITGTHHDLRAIENGKRAALAEAIEFDALNAAHVEATAFVRESREQMKIARHNETYRPDRDQLTMRPLRSNLTPEELRRKLAELKGGPPSRSTPQVQPVTPIAHTPFYTALPGLKNYAVAACRTTGPIPVDTNVTHPNSPYAFNKNMEDQTADNLSAGLGDCESRLFRRLIEVIRAGHGDQISAQWVQETAASYRPVPPPDRSSGYTPRPPREERSEPSEPGCYWDSSINARVCPK